MAKHFSLQQNVLHSLFAVRDISLDGDADKRTITLDRIELQLDQAPGVELTWSRVHALSAVRRRSPLFLLPDHSSALVDRSALRTTLHKSIAEYRVTELNGPDGAGKSTLALALAHELDLGQFPDGAVYIEGKLQYPDLLQTLFEVFYECDKAVKITPQQAYSYLYNLVALVILDDVAVNTKQIDPVLDALGNATVLLVGPERIAIGRGHAESLGGLSSDEALALFRQRAGQDYAEEQSQAVQQICAQLNNMPLPISTLAAYTAAYNRPVTKIASHLAECKAWAGPNGDLSIGPALEQTILMLDETERRLLTLMAAFTGPSVSSEILRTLTALAPSSYHQHISRLQNLGLVYSPQASSQDSSPSHLAMPHAYRQALRIWLVDDATRQEIVSYYATRLGQGDRLDGLELPNVLGAIQDCGHHHWLEPLQVLARAAGCNLAWMGWWSQWQTILDLARRTAQAQQDREFEAWAMHQLGSVQGVLGASDRDFHLLRSAQHMREGLGDEQGAALSAHNLGLLEQFLPTMPPPPRVHPPAASPTPAQEPSATNRVSTPATATPAGSGAATAPAPSQALPTASAPASSVAPPAPSATSATTQPAPSPPSEAVSEPSPQDQSRAALRRLRRRIAMVFAVLVLALSVVALRFYMDAASGNTGEPLTASWEFGDAWNAYDNQTWTQQIVIQAWGGEGDYHYSVNGDPVSQTFEITLPLCQGARDVVQVESADGQTTQVPFEFDSPFCQ